MKQKKHPNKDLNLERGLYFALALLVLLALIYFALEWKTTTDDHGYDLGHAHTAENHQISYVPLDLPMK